MRIPVTVFFLMIFIAAFLLQSWRLSSVQADFRQKKDEQDRLQKSMSVLLSQSKNNEAAQAGLQKQVEVLSQLAHQRRQHFSGMKHENSSIQRWADRALPADLIRLHARPNISSAADYRAWLSGINALPTSPQLPQNQRRAERKPRGDRAGLDTVRGQSRPHPPLPGAAR